MPRVALLLLLAPLVALAGCPSQVAPKAPAPANQCVLDGDCLSGGVCVDSVCVPPLPSAEGEGEPGGEGEGEPAGEGEGEPAGEGEGEPAGEGEGEGEPGADAQTLTVTAGPELVDALPGCGCSAPAPASNVDLQYTSASGTCRKPADVSCGLDGAHCPCSLGAGLGAASWGGSRVEQPRQGDTWIIDETVVHQGAGDGLFVARATVASDCLLSPGSLELSVNHGCCMLDCQDQIGAGHACYDYSQGGGGCATFCQAQATFATNADCLARGPVPVRIHVEVDGAFGFAREWCLTMASGDALDVVEVQRVNGRFSIAAVDPLASEIIVGAPCP